MRSGAGFEAPPASSSAVAAVPPAASLHHQPQPPHSGWHSPVPYLFGGLAAMLGLIAFALFILACSYWKLSGYLDDGHDRAGEAEGDDADTKNETKELQQFQQHIVVIMAGDEKPTFLATPMSSRASSFGDRTGGAGGRSSNGEDGDKEQVDENPSNGEGSNNHQS